VLSFALCFFVLDILLFDPFRFISRQFGRRRRGGCSTAGGGSPRVERRIVTPASAAESNFGTPARGRCHAAITAESSAVLSPRGVAPAPRANASLSSRCRRAKLFGDGGYFRVPERARQRRGCGRSGEPCWACGGFERLCGAPAGGSARAISVAWGGQAPRHHERSVRI